MSSHITIQPAQGTWVVRSDDAVLAESRNALELREGAYPPVIYVPRGDVAMALFEPSPTRTRCPWKGEASYFSFVGGDHRIADAAWSYEEPIEGDVQAIRGHLAFYPSKVTLERA